jgi:hypothetical protein
MVTMGSRIIFERIQRAFYCIIELPNHNLTTNMVKILVVTDHSKQFFVASLKIRT